MQFGDQHMRRCIVFAVGQVSWEGKTDEFYEESAPTTWASNLVQKPLSDNHSTMPSDKSFVGFRNLKVL